MKYSICQNKDAIRRMKYAHIKRALLKRHQHGKTVNAGKKVTK